MQRDFQICISVPLTTCLDYKFYDFSNLLTLTQFQIDLEAAKYKLIM